MSDALKIRHHRSAALKVAKEICDLLYPITERLIVAGSLRRRCDHVGDVEILYIPKTKVVKKDLFEEHPYNFVDAALSELLQHGVIEKRTTKSGQTTWGDLNKLAVHRKSGIPIDFFSANDANWFNYLVCRTGSAINNTRIATAAIAKGLKWHPYGSGFTNTRTGKSIRVRSEQAVFETVGLPYLEPWQR